MAPSSSSGVAPRRFSSASQSRISVGTSAGAAYSMKV
jgi:hypothetical protein